MEQERRRRLLGSFVRCFFEGADATVQDYVTGVLLDAADDGTDPADAAGILETFLAPNASARDLEGAITELLSLLHNPGSLGSVSWEESGEAAGSVLLPGSNAAGGSASTDKGSSGPDPRQGSAAAASGKLSVDALAFRPSFVAASTGAEPPLPDTLASLCLSEPPPDADSAEAWDAGSAHGAGWPQDSWPHGEGASWTGESAAGSSWVESAGAGAGWDDACHPWATGGASGSWEPPPHHRQQQQQPFHHLSQQDRTARPGGHHLRAGSAECSAFLSVLSQQFPEYSAAVLANLLAQQGGSLEATVEVLCSLESELEGQAALAGPALAEDEPSGPAFGDDDFPSLSAGGAAASPPALPGQGSSSTGYAAAAKAARGTPPGAAAAPQSTRRWAAAPSSVSPSIAASSKAPIWEARERVPQFATGAQAAAEYAAAREEARDHARLRNAYFEQATRAYMAGQRALAKELGEKGRWHGQQMRAAHGAAASHIFTQRNLGGRAGGAPAGVGPGSSGSGRGGGSRGPAVAAAVAKGEIRTVDLHGLHVSEALEVLEGVLLGLAAQSGGGRGGRLRVVVGVGQHGKVPARLPAAVKRYLADQGLAVSEPYAGLLEVVLP